MAGNGRELGGGAVGWVPVDEVGRTPVEHVDEAFVAARRGRQRGVAALQSPPPLAPAAVGRRRAGFRWAGAGAAGAGADRDGDAGHPVVAAHPVPRAVVDRWHPGRELAAVAPDLHVVRGEVPVVPDLPTTAERSAPTANNAVVEGALTAPKRMKMKWGWHGPSRLCRLRRWPGRTQCPAPHRPSRSPWPPRAPSRPHHRPCLQSSTARCRRRGSSRPAGPADPAPTAPSPPAGRTAAAATGWWWVSDSDRIGLNRQPVGGDASATESPHSRPVRAPRPPARGRAPPPAAACPPRYRGRRRRPSVAQPGARAPRLRCATSRDGPAGRPVEALPAGRLGRPACPVPARPDALSSRAGC